jgi:hypothetical protein
MKIGILTFHKTNNYGASLQAYALCKYLCNNHIEAEVIDYQNSKMENDYIKAYAVPSGLKAKLRYHIFFRKSQLTRKKAFAKFNTLINLSNDKYTEYSDMVSVAKNYDYIFVGSDQVWNYNITNNDWNFFLSFVPPNKRVAYAASIGLDKLDYAHKGIVKSLLEGYSHIGVREHQAVSLLESMGINNCELVVDPTLLLKKDDWSKLVGVPLVNKPYILLYSFGLTNEMRSFVTEMAESRNMKIVHIDGSPKNVFSKTWISARGMGPVEWVNLFYYANIIATNSFHGTAFSINFEKEFYTEMLPPPAKVNSRLINILSILKLENRIIEAGKCKASGTAVDYETINEKLDELREQSYKYIRDVVYGAQSN